MVALVAERDHVEGAVRPAFALRLEVVDLEDLGRLALSEFLRGDAAADARPAVALNDVRPRLTPRPGRTSLPGEAGLATLSLVLALVARAAAAGPGASALDARALHYAPRRPCRALPG